LPPLATPRNASRAAKPEEPRFVVRLVDDRHDWHCSPGTSLFRHRAFAGGMVARSALYCTHEHGRIANPVIRLPHAAVDAAGNRRWAGSSLLVTRRQIRLLSGCVCNRRPASIPRANRQSENRARCELAATPAIECDRVCALRPGARRCTGRFGYSQQFGPLRPRRGPAVALGAAELPTSKLTTTMRIRCCHENPLLFYALPLGRRVPR